MSRVIGAHSVALGSYRVGGCSRDRDRSSAEAKCSLEGANLWVSVGSVRK